MADKYTGTKLLLHGDGVNGSTDIRDSSLYITPLTVGGNTTISTEQSKFGDSSIKFTGTAGEGVYADADNAFDISKHTNYSLSCFVYPETGTTDGVIFSYGNTEAWNKTNGIQYRLQNLEAGGLVLYFWNGSSWAYATSSISLTINSWNYICLVKKNSIVKLYVNGSVGITSAALATTSAPLKFAVGAYVGSTTSVFKGYIDEFQVIPDYAIDPTVIPTAPFYVPNMPYWYLLQDCIAYWDFRDGSLYDIISNKLATHAANNWTVDHLGQQDSCLDLLNTDQVTWTSLGTIGDTLCVHQSGTFAWNFTPIYNNGINTSASSTTTISFVLIFNRVMTSTERSQIESLLKERYIYPTQKAAMQE